MKATFPIYCFSLKKVYICGYLVVAVLVCSAVYVPDSILGKWCAFVGFFRTSSPGVQQGRSQLFCTGRKCRSEAGLAMAMFWL